MSRRLILLISAILLALPVVAGVNRYIVFLNDKNGTEYNIDRPDEFLTQRALQRRAKHKIHVSEDDLPVSRPYIVDLVTHGFPVYFTSKWLNAVLTECEDSKLGELSALYYVKGYELIGPGSRLSGENSGRRSGTNGLPDSDQMTLDELPATALQNEMMGVDKMHEKGFRGEGLMIGVFDSGFANVLTSRFFSNLVEEDRIVEGKDFVGNSGNVFQYDTHGTKVLSCMAAYSDSEYIGIAYEADYLLCVTEDVQSEYRIEEYNWLFAAEYADSMGVDVINSSVGYSFFDDETMDYTYKDLDGNTAVITRAGDLAASKGILVVSSNGNEGNDNWLYLNAPADGDSILSVGSVDSDLVRAGFSSFGPSSDQRIKPDVAALGVWARVVRDNDVTISSGTSFSSPMIAGLAAGFWQAFPSLTNMEVIEYLKMSSSNAGQPDTLIGYGVPDFMKAYNQVRINEGDIMSEFVVYPNPVDGTRIIYIFSDTFFEEGRSRITLFDLKGATLSVTDIDLDEQNMPIPLNVSFLRPGSYILTCEQGNRIKKSKIVIL